VTPPEAAQTPQLRRHHIRESSVQQVVTATVRLSGINNRSSCESRRQQFAALLLEDGKVARTIPELLGYADI
jgi:site-specific recombinase XerD